MLWKKPGRFFVLQMGRDFLCFRTNGNYFFMHIGGRICLIASGLTSVLTSGLTSVLASGIASVLASGGKSTSYVPLRARNAPYFGFTTISISSGCLFNQACTKGQYTFTGR